MATLVLRVRRSTAFLTLPFDRGPDRAMESKPESLYQFEAIEDRVEAHVDRVCKASWLCQILISGRPKGR